MDRSDILDRIAEVLAGARSQPLGVAGLMIESEIAAGRQIIQPGDAEPFLFLADDWVYPAVVSYSGRDVWITAILAKHPGRGAFRRLIGNIQGAGLRPVVVEPIGQMMPAILKRWGWRGRRVGSGIDQTSEWRPSSSLAPSDATALAPSKTGQDRDEHVNNPAKTQHVPPTCKGTDHV